MPIITIQAIQGVVLTSPEQKRELLQKMTDTFISVVGEVARPYTYCLIQETPLMEWSIAGKPLPDLPFLYGPEYAAMHANANKIMRDFVEGAAGRGRRPREGQGGQGRECLGRGRDLVYCAEGTQVDNGQVDKGRTDGCSSALVSLIPLSHLYPCLPQKERTCVNVRRSKGNYSPMERGRLVGRQVRPGL